MILTFEEARRLGGRFYEFEYATIVSRTEQSKHFGCFANNDSDTFVLKQKIYGWDAKDIMHMINEWNSKSAGPCSMYNYVFLSQTSRQSYTPEQVLERIYASNGFKFLANLITLGSIDVIH